MLRNNLLLLSCICVLFSCKKKDDDVTSDVAFYDEPRTILYSNSFEDGLQSSELDDKEFTDTIKGLAYLQTGINYRGEEKPNGERDYFIYQCDGIEPGYLKVGCVDPITEPIGYEKELSFELTVIGILYSYSEEIELNINLEASNTIALQIDYQKAGSTEIHMGIYKLKSQFDEGEFDDKSIHISINHVTGDYTAYSDGTNINEKFIMIEEPLKKSHVKFIADREVEFLNGVPYVHLTGMRIDLIEVYRYK